MRGYAERAVRAVRLGCFFATTRVNRDQPVLRADDQWAERISRLRRQCREGRHQCARREIDDDAEDRRPGRELCISTERQHAPLCACFRARRQLRSGVRRRKSSSVARGAHCRAPQRSSRSSGIYGRARSWGSQFGEASARLQKPSAFGSSYQPSLADRIEADLLLPARASERDVTTLSCSGERNSK